MNFNKLSAKLFALFAKLSFIKNEDICQCSDRENVQKGMSFLQRLCHTKWLIFAGILRGSASNFNLSGGACGRGALRRGGSLFEKSSAKTFFGRFAVFDMEIAKSFWFSSRSREENAA